VRDPKNPYRFRRDEGGWLYVERAGELREKHAPASEEYPIDPDVVGSLGEFKNHRAEKSVSDDWRNHALDCECVECVSPMPTYATARGGS
jgi:hypothetical protein